MEMQHHTQENHHSIVISFHIARSFLESYLEPQSYMLWCDMMIDILDYMLSSLSLSNSSATTSPTSPFSPSYSAEPQPPPDHIFCLQHEIREIFSGSNSGPNSGEEESNTLCAIFLHNWLAHCTYTPPHHYHQNQHFQPRHISSLIPFIPLPDAAIGQDMQEVHESFLKALGLWGWDVHAERGVVGNWECLRGVLEEGDRGSAGGVGRSNGGNGGNEGIGRGVKEEDVDALTGRLGGLAVGESVDVKGVEEAMARMGLLR